MSSDHFNFCPIDGRPFLANEDRCAVCATERDALLFSARVSNASHSQQPRWRKLLYVKQDYPDNYVDHTFLEEMQKNANVRQYEYKTVVKESGVITQHLCSIVIFVAAFIHVYNDHLSILSLISFGNTLTLAGYIFWDQRLRHLTLNYRDERLKTLKAAFLFFLTLMVLSPILKTLTSDTSDDTIWALTVCLFLMNLLLHDYGSSNTTNIRYPGSLSTNAAIFASVLLASRLTSNLHVFGLILFAIEWFALFPILRRSLKVITTFLIELMDLIVSRTTRCLKQLL